MVCCVCSVCVCLLLFSEGGPGARSLTHSTLPRTAPMATEVASRAIQCLGGYGYVGEYVVERLWRDARLIEIGGGTNEARGGCCELEAGHSSRPRAREPAGMERALACFVSGRVSGLCRGVVAVVMLAGEGGLAWACHRACRPRHAYDACGSARPCCCRGMACGCQWNPS